VASGLLKAAFGSVRLYVADLDGDIGRTLVVHEPSSGEDYTIQDRGRRLERSQLELCFCPVPGETEDHLARYARFKALVDEGKPQIFVHPLHGSYRARVGDCRLMVADDTAIRLSVEFVQVAPPKDIVRDVGAGVVPAAGPEAVEVEVVKANAELAAQGLTSSAPDEAQSTVQGWQEIDVDEDTRRVYVEATSLVDKIDADMSRLQMAVDIKRWPLYVRFILLRDKVLAAAESATAVTTQVFEFIVQVGTPLRVLCARTYGADQAEDRAREVRQLNNLREPGLVPAGTVLKMPVPGAAR
jgi:hypothetical protein